MNEYASVKTYGHDRGLSCAFRQWKADSHCKWIHGYALAFEFTFIATELDTKNWVVDFGGLKKLEQWLRATFDHKTVVAKDDPELALFEEMSEKGLVDLVILPATGCEKFAEFAFKYAANLIAQLYGERCRLESVKVSEHGSNSAICRGR